MPVSAMMLTGTSCRRSLRLVAVTTISASVSDEAFAPTLCAKEGRTNRQAVAKSVALRKYFIRVPQFFCDVAARGPGSVGRSVTSAQWTRDHEPMPVERIVNIIFLYRTIAS